MMLFSVLKSFLNKLFNNKVICETLQADNLIEKRKTNLINNFIFPKDIANIISSFDYNLEGNSIILENQFKSINHVAVLSDSRIISVYGRQTIKIWNLVTESCDITFQDTDFWITCVDILLDGRIITGLKYRWSDEYSFFKIWNPVTGKCEDTILGCNNDILCIVVLCDGRFVCGFKCGLEIRNIQDDERIILEPYHNWSTNCIAILGDKRIASGKNNGIIKIWNTLSGTCDIIIEAFNGTVKHIATLLDGRIFCTSKDGKIKIYDPSTGICNAIINKPDESDSNVTCLCVLPDGHIVCGCDNKLKIFDPLVINYTVTLNGNDGKVLCVNILPDGRIVSGSVDGFLKLWS